MNSCNCNQNFNECGKCARASLRNIAPSCKTIAIIPSITVENLQSMKGLADCFVHVISNNTTYYIDNNGRLTILSEGLVTADNYDILANPLKLQNQLLSTKIDNVQQVVFYDAQRRPHELAVMDNLQDAVNDKLDEMVEDGTLADIVADYIQLKGILAYDTVADLKTADNVVDGSLTETYGYYNAGDNGGAKYKIRTKTGADTPDDMTVIAIGDTLVAELINQNGYMTPEMFGAYGDGETDDTAAIQTAIDFTDTVVFNKSYSISRVYLHSGSKLIGNGTIIGSTQGRMIDIVGTISTPLQNVTINGLTLRHEDVTFTQQAFIVYIKYAQNVDIKNCYFTHWTGDAICMDNFQSTDKLTSDINIVDNKFINNHTGRQGITILTASNVNIKDNYFKDTSYSQMPGAIDIEPWYNASTGDLEEYVIENINIDGNYCENSVYNTSFVNVYVKSTQNMYNFNITNNTVNNTNTASGIKIQTSSGDLSGVKNVYIVNNSISAPFINLLISGFDAVVENNSLIDGLISLGNAYATNKLSIGNIKLLNNTYSNTSANANSENVIISTNLDTDSKLIITGNNFNMGDTTSTKTNYRVLENLPLTGKSNPTVKPIYTNNKFIYLGSKATAAFANNEYGVYSDNEIINGTSSSVNLSIILNKDDYSYITSNVTEISHNDNFTPTAATTLETVRTITIPAYTPYAISVYATRNNTDINQLAIEVDGTWVADSGTTSARGKQSVQYVGMTGSSASTITIKAMYSSVGMNMVYTRGYYFKPIYTASV